ncbi:tyrosine-type recombinase/integrase [Nocardia sp. KC 131]|uniref:tyrosine-type recombinase/integrase n=1 Tax=Nocardia arseniciresistens TaxID=3392119 RepID=UPI00398EF428
MPVLLGGVPQHITPGQCGGLTLRPPIRSWATPSGNVGVAIPALRVRAHVLKKHRHLRLWNGAAKAAGLKGLTPHEMRHTAASLAVSQGASVLGLQRMLGHDRPSATLDFYADLFDDDLDDVAAKRYSLRTQPVVAVVDLSKKTA